MRITDFTNSAIITEAFGKARVAETIRNIKEVWPGLIPTYYEPLTPGVVAWLLFILSYSKKTTKDAVRLAIKHGKKLHARDLWFIEWFTNLLSDPKEAAKIKNVFIFYEYDFPIVHATSKVQDLNDPNADGSVLIFQGQDRTSYIRRAAILEGELLYAISEMIVTPEEDMIIYDEDGEHRVTIEEYISKAKEVLKVPQNLAEIKEMEDSLRNTGTDEATIKRHVDKAKATYEKWNKSQK